jgi:flagellar basal-body rod modification protein FlgD
MTIEAIGSNYVNSLATWEEETPSVSRDEEMGKDQFLTLLVAQLRHQDPLNPMESTEFTAQLAQYSSLEQLFNINDNLELMKSSQDQNARFQALSLIGKDVVVPGDMLHLGQTEGTQGAFVLGNNADCTVTIVHSDGYAVRRLPMGGLEAGRHEFQWDGLDEEGNLQQPGVYYFEITALSDSGGFIGADTQITGRVTRVNLESSTPLLYVGDIPVTLDQLAEIKVPAINQEDTQP